MEEKAVDIKDTVVISIEIMEASTIWIVPASIGAHIQAVIEIRLHLTASITEYHQ